MPVFVVVAILLLACVLLVVVLFPVALFLRFRGSSARRRARGWVVSLNLVSVLISAATLVIAAAVSNAWIPDAFRYTIGGLAVGVLLGILGLALTRWEQAGPTLYYTPNRLLMLAITVVVTARIFYGFWRGWEAWRATLRHESFLVAAGAAGSMAAGAVVLGYYVVYWIGLRNRLRKQTRLRERA